MSDDNHWASWFDASRAILEDAYLQGITPWQQSGFGLHTPRTEREWRTLRHPIVDCLLDALRVERRAQPVHFLDIGCANGYLLESCASWAAEMGVTLIPWGLDLSGKLIALARRRLPAYADRMFAGNAWTWRPPRRFDAVRTELCYVPEPLRKRYVERLLADYLADDGILLIAEYRGRTPDGIVSTLSVDETLRSWGFPVATTCSGALDGVERVRVAAVRAPAASV